jgi:drug/metabolite transporter (DMT)-like permease
MSNFAHLWVVFSLLSAFFQASRIAVTKQLSFIFSAQALTFFVNFASLCITLPLIIWHHDFPLQEPRYLSAVLAGALLSGFGGWSFNYAIKISEVSIVGPLITLTPGFVIIIEWLLLGDMPSETGFLGIGLLCAGSYILSLDGVRRDWLGPLLRIFSNPGSRYAFIASFCFACASVLGREAIRLSEPVSFAVMVAIINPVVLFIIFSTQNLGFYKELIGSKARAHIGALALLGGLFALMRLADQMALSLTLASYAMALKRMAGVFSVIIGHYLFREPRMPIKLLASVIMVLGVLAMIED